MSEKRILRDAEIFALAGHDVDGIVQQRLADLASRFRHENARARLPPHHHRQRADVVLMRMRYDDRFRLSIFQRLEIRQRFFAGEFRMHSAIEDEALAVELEKVRIRADFGAARQINEFHCNRSRATAVTIFG